MVCAVSTICSKNFMKKFPAPFDNLWFQLHFSALRADFPITLFKATEQNLKHAPIANQVWKRGWKNTVQRGSTFYLNHKSHCYYLHACPIHFPTFTFLSCQDCKCSKCCKVINSRKWRAFFVYCRNIFFGLSYLPRTRYCPSRQQYY